MGKESITLGMELAKTNVTSSNVLRIIIFTDYQHARMSY